jgi:putative PIN family toxin of toxin-antitoxin system
MNKKTYRIIIDTNLWISFLISKRLQKTDSLFNQDGITFIFSNELIEEFLEVAARPKFKKYFKQSDIQKIVDFMDCCSEIIEVKSSVDICRDKKDNFLLALALDSKADFLITGDEDLLIIKQFHYTEILSYNQFTLKMK